MNTHASIEHDPLGDLLTGWRFYRTRTTGRFRSGRRVLVWANAGRSKGGLWYAHFEIGSHSFGLVRWP